MSFGRRDFGAKLKSPCFKCTERRVGCHSKCDRYKKYRTEYDKLNDKEKREKLISNTIILPCLYK